MTSITDLPQTTLVQIFSHFKLISESNNLRLVCQLWNELILSYWSREEKLTLTRYITDPNLFLEYISANAARHPRIKELKLEPIDKSRIPHTIADIPCHYHVIGNVFIRLEKIIFYDNLMEDRAFHLIVKNCSKLRSIFLHSCNIITDLGVSSAIKNTPQIKELEIFGCPEVDCDLAVDCHHLSYLGFEECPFGADSWTSLSESGGKNNLEKLAFSPIDYDILCLISHKFPCLKQLYIAEFNDQDNFVYENYHGFPLLETLCVTYGSVSDKDDVFHIVSKCPKIRTLWIWNCVNTLVIAFIDEVMGVLINSIEHLIIDGVKSSQLKSMNLRNFFKLKKVTIIGAALNNQVIQRLIDACPSLSHLDIADCVPPDQLEIQATNGDFWLNLRGLTIIPSCINTEPPFRANYKNAEDVYEGPVLELSCGAKQPRYHFIKT